MCWIVDGIENSEGADAAEAVLIGAEDPAFAGGSYVLVQKYLHDLDAWDALSTEAQELVIGHTKLIDLELPERSSRPTFTCRLRSGDPERVHYEVSEQASASDPDVGLTGSVNDPNLGPDHGAMVIP